MRIYPALLIAAASLSLPGIASAAQHHRPIGQETTIASAAGGGIRNWQAGPKGSDILYMQDRTLNWYRVQMSGPCLKQAPDIQTMTYTTDTSGQLDTFSTLHFVNLPGLSCGIRSIKTSLPPPGQPGAPKPAH